MNELLKDIIYFDKKMDTNDLIKGEKRKHLNKEVIEELKKFSKEDIINIFFDLEANDEVEGNKYNGKLKEEKEKNEYIFSNSNKNNLCKLNAFIQVLREKYMEEEIINFLYNNLINFDLFQKDFDQKKVEENNIFLNKKSKNINHQENNLKLKKRLKFKIIHKNDIIIDNLLNIDNQRKDILGLMHKNEKEQIYLFRPLDLAENNQIEEKFPKEKLNNSNEILFKCEMNNCPAYGICDILNKKFKLCENHLFSYKEHKINRKLQKKIMRIDENIHLMKTTFEKLKSDNALILNGSKLYELIN